MLTVPKLITALQRRGVLPEADVARLQQLHAAAPSEFGVRVMLKWLVNRGRITAEQAEKLQQARAGASAEKLLKELFPASGDVELTIADDDDHEEDTKDLLPDEGIDQQQLTLPPRGSPTFAGGVPPRKPAPASAEPLIAPDGSANTTAASGVGGYSDLVSELFSGGGVDLAAPQSLPQTRRKTRQGNRWDSPLMLVGGAALLVLVLGGAFLLWRIGRQSGDDAFSTAEAAYGEGSYARAVDLYDKFLADYPSHPAAGRAVVHRGLSRIRLAVETTNDWSRARQTAAEVLAEIAPHEDFGSVRPDLGVLLPDIAQHLARQALAKNDATLLAETREAQGLIDKYLPPSDVLRARNAETETLIAQTQRRLDRDFRTMETVATMKAAVAKRDIAAAFKAHAAFIAGDGAAVAAPALRAALLEVAQSAAQGVRFVAAATQAETGEPAAGPELRFAPLMTTQGSTIEALRGAVLTTIAGGTAFAFDGADGKLLWRRTVGFDSILPPQRIGAATTADTVLHDSVCREFLVVDTATGALRRRFAAPQPSSDSNQRSWAAVYDQQLYVTLASGRLYVFDLTTGASKGYVEFPQPLQQAASVDPRGRVLYQVADDGVVYTLATADLRVLESGVLGESGDATTAPFCVGSYLLLFERRGDAGRMLVHEVDRDGLKPKAIGRHEFATYVPLSPVTSQRYVATVDLAGTLKVFDFSAREADLLVKPVAEYRTAGDKQLRFVAFQGTQLWVAGNQLERLELQTTLGKLSQVRAFVPRSHALQPPLVTTDHVIYAFRDGERRGANVAAISKADGQESWSAHLSVPAAAPIVDGHGRRILFAADGVDLKQFDVGPTAATATGVSTGKLSTRIVPNVSRLLGPPLTTDADTIALPVVHALPAQAGSSGTANSTNEKHALLVFRKGAAPSELPLSFDGHPPAAEPSVFQNGILLPTSVGPLRWLAVAEKAAEIAPFQPPLIAGTTTEWTKAEIADNAIVVSDRRMHLYHLRLQATPSPHLTIVGQSSLLRALVGNLAVVGTMVYVVDSAQTLQAFKLPDLAAGPTWNLPEACLWNGPVASGKFVFVATSEPEGVRCKAFDDRGQLVWEKRLPVGTLPPVVANDSVFIADVRGGIARLNAADGRESRRIETGLAITYGPVVAGDKLLVTTVSGELVEMTQP